MAGQKIPSKFRGCLVGSLFGDCMGAPFEGQEVSSGDKLVIQRYFDRMEDPTFKGPFKKYTDDTAMMKSVGQFLVDTPEPDLKHLAQLFTSEYFKQPRRGYGAGVISVFEKLKKSKFEDIFQPSKEQFNGQGSYGNGGAMRIAPIPLYFHDDFDNMLNIAVESTKITHSNELGIHGAVLQCLAIHQAFLADPDTPINVQEFCDQLLEKMRAIEEKHYGDVQPDQDTPYCERIKVIQKLLSAEHSDYYDDEVIRDLGNDISAIDSVPTAIFCFLRAQNPIPGIKTDNIFRRTTQYAITLGGDTDTIACMAGAIAGAYLGEESINKSILQHCEKVEDIVKLADSLCAARPEPKNS